MEKCMLLIAVPTILTVDCLIHNIKWKCHVVDVIKEHSSNMSSDFRQIDDIILEYKAASIVMTMGKSWEKNQFHIANINGIQAYIL